MPKSPKYVISNTTGEVFETWTIEGVTSFAPLQVFKNNNTDNYDYYKGDDAAFEDHQQNCLEADFRHDRELFNARLSVLPPDTGTSTGTSQCVTHLPFLGGFGFDFENDNTSSPSVAALEELEATRLARESEIASEAMATRPYESIQLHPGDYQKRLLERDQFGMALREERRQHLAMERVLKASLAAKIEQLKK
jgi:hypothetical protein